MILDLKWLKDVYVGFCIVYIRVGWSGMLGVIFNMFYNVCFLFVVYVFNCNFLF